MTAISEIKHAMERSRMTQRELAQRRAISARVADLEQARKEEQA